MKLRTVLFWCHLIAGISIGAVIFCMAASGALMAFEPQMTAIVERNVRNVQGVPGVRRLSLKEITAKAGENNSGMPATGVMVGASPSASVAVLFGKETTIYMNPYTGEFLGRGSKIHDWLHNVEDFHRTLLGGETGSWITGAACFMLLGMVLSGLYLWWPREWKWPGIKAVFFYNFALSGKARDWNLHNVTGLWFAPLLLTTTLTGLIMAYPWANALLFRLTGNEPPPSKQSNVILKPAAPNETSKTAADFDTLFSSIQKRVPGWQSMSIRLPREPQGPATAYIQESGSPSFIRSQLTLDASTAEILKWEPRVRQNLGRRLRAWVRPLHTGVAGGIMGQFFALLSAIGAMTLVWTGFAMAWRRFFLKKISAPAAAGKF